MSSLRPLSALVPAAASCLLYAASAQATTDCQFAVHHESMVLQGDCQTDATIFVPDGFTLRGRNFTITAVDPPGGHFLGAVVRNAGSRASVERLQITTSNLSDVCDAGDNALRGIQLVGASGSIIGNVIRNLNQAAGHSGCQEGNAITAQSFGSTERVRIEGNLLDAYQKTGIVVSGNVDAVVRANAVTGFGPVDFIAQNGIQIGFGADARVEANVVTGNSYTGTAGHVEASGILVVGGPTLTGCSVTPCPYTTGLRISHNLLLENDVGVLLDNPGDATGAAPPTPTDNVVEENAIFKSSLTNGSKTQVGVFDIGNHDRIIGNTISGRGYDPVANPGAFTRQIFADPPFAIDPVIRRNHLFP
jgi:hypothetical protein